MLSTTINGVMMLLFGLLIGVLSMPQPGKVISDEINTIGKGDVGVSWGGYSASAGLGGGANAGGAAGGVLHAQAHAPSVGASTGLGGYAGSHSSEGPIAGGAAGAGAGASAGAGGGAGAGGFGSYGPPCHGADCEGPNAGFFDNIFNIPISVLKAVNTYLNQKGPSGGPNSPPPPNGPTGAPHPHPHPPPPPPPHHGGNKGPTEHHHAVIVSETSAGSGAFASAGAIASASASAGTGTGATAGVSTGCVGDCAGGGGGVVHTYHTKHGGQVDFDGIFNIPISALKSVNQLLNG